MTRSTWHFRVACKDVLRVFQHHGQEPCDSLRCVVPHSAGQGMAPTTKVYLLSAELRLQVPLVHDCGLRASGCKEAAAALLPVVDRLVPGAGT